MSASLVGSEMCIRDSPSGMVRGQASNFGHRVGRACSPSNRRGVQALKDRGRARARPRARPPW
eukprot:13085753-Alexandrium_andersonii.AAC.1